MHKNRNFKLSAWLLSVDPVAQYCRGMHAECVWEVIWPDVYEADLSQSCLVLVMRKTLHSWAEIWKENSVRRQFYGWPNDLCNINSPCCHVLKILCCISHPRSQGAFVTDDTCCFFIIIIYFIFFKDKKISPQQPNTHLTDLPFLITDSPFMQVKTEMLTSLERIKSKWLLDLTSRNVPFSHKNTLVWCRN